MYNPVIDIQQPFGEVLTRGLVPWIRAAVQEKRGGGLLVVLAM